MNKDRREEQASEVLNEKRMNTMYRIMLKTAVTAIALFSAAVSSGSEIPGHSSSASAYPTDNSAVITGDARSGAAIKAYTGTGSESLLAASQTMVYRDRYGNKIGTASTDGNGHTVYRDRYGNKTGSAVTDRYGKTVIRDRYGNKVGTASTDSRGRAVVRDRYGQKIGTVESNRRGKVTVRDRYGRKTAESR